MAAIFFGNSHRIKIIIKGEFDVTEFEFDIRFGNINMEDQRWRPIFSKSSQIQFKIST